MPRRYRDWYRQAENDLEWAEHSLNGGFYAQTCFIAQQAAEKALKALALFRGYDVVRTHSLFRLCQELGIDGDLQERAKDLDLYYVSGRYPNGVPEGAPFEVFPRHRAEEALESARVLVDRVRRELEAEG